MSLCFFQHKLDSNRHYLISDFKRLQVVFVSLHAIMHKSFQIPVHTLCHNEKPAPFSPRQGRFHGVNANLSIHHTGPPGPKGPVGPPGPSGLNVSLLRVQC